MEAHDNGEQVQGQFEINVAEDLEGGTYANFLGVWHTGHEFTLDFGVTQPAEQQEAATSSEPEIKVPVRIVARVKIPPTLVFATLQALSDNLARYEETFHEIKRLDD